MTLFFPHRLIAVVAFLAAAIVPLPALADEAAAPFVDNVQLRGSIDNSRIKFERHRKGNVAFLGGSITEMEGFRPMVCQILRKRFPETVFTFTNAGIASTCSTTGAFRLKRDVLEHGPVDLLFVEFAVNDDQDASHTRDECVRGLEGIIRHARAANPNTDIVVTFFVNEAILEALQAGQTPLTIEAHETVAKHYGIPTIHLAREVAQQITDGRLTWAQYGGVHPAPPGNTICATMIDELFSRAWSKPLPSETDSIPHRETAKPLDPLSYSSARFVDPAAAQVIHGWKLEVPDWKQLPGAKRSRFTSIPMLSSTEPGSELALDFEGTAIGAFIVAGPDAGIAEVSIDGGPINHINLHRSFSSRLHYPYTVMLGTDLPPGKHRLSLRISNETKSQGCAMRIMQFCVN